jgi:hypothetical protein
VLGDGSGDVHLKGLRKYAASGIASELLQRVRDTPTVVVAAIPIATIGIAAAYLKQAVAVVLHLQGLSAVPPWWGRVAHTEVAVVLLVHVPASSLQVHLEYPLPRLWGSDGGVQHCCDANKCDNIRETVGQSEDQQGIAFFRIHSNEKEHNNAQVGERVFAQAIWHLLSERLRPTRWAAELWQRQHREPTHTP